MDKLIHSQPVKNVVKVDQPVLCNQEIQQNITDCPSVPIYGRDSTDLKVSVLNPAHTSVGTQKLYDYVPQLASETSWRPLPSTLKGNYSIISTVKYSTCTTSCGQRTPH